MLVVDYFEKNEAILKDGDDSIFIDRAILPPNVRIGDVIRIKIIESSKAAEALAEDEPSVNVDMTVDENTNESAPVSVDEDSRPMQIFSVVVPFSKDKENVVAFRMYDQLELSKQVLPENVKLPCRVDFIIDQEATVARADAIRAFEEEYDKRDNTRYISTDREKDKESDTE